MNTENTYEENIALSSGKLADEKEYWLKKLDGKITLARFPYITKSYNHTNNDCNLRKLNFKLNKQITQRLLKISQGSNDALFVLLLSGIKCLLYRCMGDEDIVVGMPVFKNKITNHHNQNILLLRNKINPDFSFREVLVNIRQVIEEADNNANIPLKTLCKLIHIESSEKTLCFGSLVLLDNVHNTYGLDTTNTETIFKFKNSDNEILLEISYESSLFNEAYINQIVNHLTNLFSTVLTNPDTKLSNVDILNSSEKNILLNEFNSSQIDFGLKKTIHQYFEEQVKKHPQKSAIVFNNKSISYEELDTLSNQVSQYLVKEKKIEKNNLVGIYMENSSEQIVSILGIMKSGAAYIPIDSNLPEERIKSIINEAGIKVIISKKEYIKNLNRLQWLCPSFHSFLCLDSHNISQEKEVEKSQLMHEGLWEYVGQTSTDEISGGGWSNSYSGENFTKLEMDEYGDNILKKVKPLLNKNSKVLEIGCASGITMYRIAPLVKLYYGTDMSNAIIEKNKSRNIAENIENIRLEVLASDQIDQIELCEFDIIIINSVIQCFHGHNYLRDTLSKAIKLLKKDGMMFIGDVMGLETKNKLVNSITDFKNSNPEKAKNAKLNWDEELFVAKAYFEDLKAEFQEIAEVNFSDKICTIENELTKFRYDVIIKVNKDNTKRKIIKHKYQDDLSNLIKHKSDNLNINSQFSDLAYVIYTSGTTGNPKGVMINHKALANLCFWHNNFYEVTSNDNATRYAGFGFDASVWELFPYLIKGATIHIIDNNMKLDLKKLNDYFEQNNITFSFLPTQLCEQFVEFDNRSLKCLLTGGDKLKSFKFRKYKLFNNYGPTENAVVSTVLEVDKNYKNIPIGKPISNVQVYILDKFLNLQPIGMPGELCISGKSLSTGYLNSKKLTEEKFIDNPFEKSSKIYKTGDLARWLPNGDIEFLGRIDHQVKIRSYRIELGDIENTLLRNENITEAIVIDNIDDTGNKYLHAYIVSKNKVEINELKNFLAQKLPYYMIPSKFNFLKSIPLTSNGKVNRKALLSDTNIIKADKQHKPPQNNREEKILTIWKDVLCLREISIDDNFFELGGNSLKAVSVHTHLSLDFDVEINDLFKYPTITQLAEKISNKKDNLKTSIEAIKLELANSNHVDIPTRSNNIELKSYYKKIDEYYSNIDLTCCNSFRNILLTGSTGFLGINMVLPLLESTESKIYVLVRAKDKDEARKRFERKLDFHFNDFNYSKYKNRIIVLKGDMCLPQFGLKSELYIELSKNIDCIINSAANVKHYGRYEDFHKTNVAGVENLIQFAQKNEKKEIHHISTIGVANGNLKDKTDCFFTEDDCEIGQDIDNFYIKTKLLAEKRIIDARTQGLKANIYRVGNLMFDSNTGLFQENISENGFYKILQSLINIGFIPNSDMPILDFSFINQVSKSIALLIHRKNIKNETFHIFNHNLVMLNDLNKLFNISGISSRSLEWNDFLDLLYDNYNNKELKESIENFLLHSHLLQNQGKTKYHLVFDKTKTLLDKIGFQWEILNKSHIKKMIEHCLSVNFLKESSIHQNKN